MAESLKVRLTFFYLFIAFSKCYFPVTFYRRQWSKPSPRKRNAKRQNDCLRRPYIAVNRREAKGKGEKERYSHLNAEFQRIRRDKKAFLSDQFKEIEGNKRMGKRSLQED